jgi:tetratricopeptide (TPR) repeat protein
MASALPQTVAGRVEQLCSEGDAFVTSARYDAAVLRYTTAFRLMPRPQDRWTTTPRIFASIIDACFGKGDFVTAREAVMAALECPGVDTNPALRLKLGEILYEQGQFSAAREQLKYALEHGGREVFEDEDEKYWLFLSQSLGVE